jgi:hypothetical protein
VVASRSHRARGLLRAALAFVVPVSLIWSAPPDRIQEVRADQSIVLKGSVHPRVTAAIDEGALDPATRISGLRMVLKPSPAQQTALELLLEEQRDPSSPNYRKWAYP